MKIHLQVCPKPDTAFDREFDEHSITVGRSRDCELIIAHDVVSSRHAKIECGGNGHLLFTDLGSTNGSYLNSSRVHGTETISVGDEIRLGQEGPRIRIVSFVPDEETQRATPQGPFAFKNDSFSLPAPQWREPTQKAPSYQPASVVAKEPTATGSDSTTRVLLRKLEERQSRWGAFAIGSVIGLVGVGFLTAVVLLVVMFVTSGSKEIDVTAIFNQYSGSVYLVAAELPNGRIAGIGTAFPTDLKGTFGTNAHVARAIEELLDAGAEIKVYSQLGEGAFEVKSARDHPKYRDDDDPDFDKSRYYPDVGVLEVRIPTNQQVVPVKLATSSDLGRLEPGVPLCFIGFPAYRDDDYSTLNKIKPLVKEGRLLRAFDFFGESGDWQELQLLEHDMETWHGASGSPVFRADGKVVGLIWGGLTVREGIESATLPFGVRVDALRELLDD